MELKVTLQGGKKVATQVGNHLIETDQSVKQGGADSAPAPYDLFVASIATCAGFYVQSYCQNKGIDTAGIEISMDSRFNPDKKAIDGFITTIRVPASLPENLDATLIRVAQQCAVKKTIMAGPEFIVQTQRIPG